MVNIGNVQLKIFSTFYLTGDFITWTADCLDILSTSGIGDVDYTGLLSLHFYYDGGYGHPHCNIRNIRQDRLGCVCDNCSFPPH